MLKRTTLFILLFLTTALYAPPSLIAASTTSTMADFTAYPPFVTTAAPPLTMFILSKNHKQFYKAYTDIIDLDNDGTIDATYNDTIDYYGYFDAIKCYDYVGGGSRRFEPGAYASGSNLHSCTGRWSGNFLNWATMSRMDLIRKVLYGGTRETDTATTTVLGRALLPQDAHSWVKTYTGSDISSLTPYSWSEISLCNTNTAQNQNSSLLLVLDGYFPYAASTEGRQCEREEPGGASLTIETTLNVDVQVCVTGMLEDNCIEYKTGSSTSNYKPSGLMQTFGVDRNGTPDSTDDTLLMKFGLMTGSYGANVSGGVLRSNIGDLRNSEVDNGNGIILGASKIIKNIDSFRVLQYRWADGWYRAGGSEGTCVPSEPTILTNNGVCTSWGNPIGEMLYETIRYFQAEGGPTSEFEPSTTDPGLSSLDVENSWDDPYANCPACSKPFTIILSDENPSYDSDDLPDSYWASGISTSDTPSVQSLIATSNIDILESITGGFIGESAGTFDRNCTSKPISFASIRGLCVEEPTKQGSYYLAGLAHYAKTTDLRPDIDGDQKMTTYAVSTGSTTPNLEFTVDSKKVVVVPIFHDGCPDTSYSGCGFPGDHGDNSKGAMVDFLLCPNDTDWVNEQAAEGFTSCYDGMWDDAEYGWDYELDIRYRIYIKTGASTITIKTKGMAAAAGHEGFAGYAISGVTLAGDYYEIRCGGAAGFSDCDRFDQNELEENTRTFAVTGTTSGFLKSPLWYAAKYGGFNDSDSSDTPNIVSEWDADGDGDPDTYFNAANPLNLEAQLSKALTDILNRSSSGTSVSVLATSGEGEGALYQAYFFPSKYEAGVEKKWIGYMHSLFLDTFGNLREDSNGDGKLTYVDDKIVRSFYDASSGESKVKIYSDADGDGRADSDTEDSIIAIDAVKPIWEAGKKLAKRAAADRTIYTWLNTDNDGTVDSGEFISFDDTSAASLAPYLLASDLDGDGSRSDEAEDIINFVRGADGTLTGMRDRTLTVDGNPEVWKLGDIVYSTPSSVGAPRERFDLIYGDDSYRTFYNQYKDRRNVVYVGANDGMLHAFNAGFYKPGDDDDSSTSEVIHGRFDTFEVGGAASPSDPELGEELWGYIPYELLPHLGWMTQTDYSHVYYVDLKPKITDVRIFTPDATHPNGWGTILIGGMRLGGGPITVDDGSFSSPTNRTFHSAYFVLDITDPEVAPVLISSLPTSTSDGFTTSYPAIVRATDGGSSPVVSWFALAGTGPTDYDGSSTSSGKIHVYDIATGGNPIREYDTGISNAFLGDPISLDVDLNYTSNIGYIGLSYLDAGTWKGHVLRIKIDGDSDPANWQFSEFYAGDSSEDNLGPVIAAPTAALDSNNDLWVYFGTGRYYTPTDAADLSPQRYHGIKDPCFLTACATKILESQLLDSTDIQVYTDGSLTSAGVVSDQNGDGTVDFADLLATTEGSASTVKGWYVDLEASGERVLAKATILGEILFFTTFVPDSDECSAGGESFVNALYYTTGTANTSSSLGDDPPDPDDSPALVISEKALGKGLPSAIGIHLGNARNAGGGGTCSGGVKGFVQQSTGTITEICASPNGGIRSGVKGWRDF